MGVKVSHSFEKFVRRKRPDNCIVAEALLSSMRADVAGEYPAAAANRVLRPNSKAEPTWNETGGYVRF